ncbi:MAG: YfiR family protein [Methylotenera sp.]|nr:YfiR family protein [Methylotenera sp.]
MSYFRLTLILVLGAMSILMNIQPAYAASEDLERQVISAYIFKFGNYITWPDNTFADSSSPIIIGIVEEESIANELETIASGHLTGNRSVIIKKLNPQNMNTDVHILYVPSGATKLLTTYRNAHPGAATLYITNTAAGLNSGGTINFVRDNNRLRFDVSLPAAEQNRIKLDASLLTVTRQVLKE